MHQRTKMHSLEMVNGDSLIAIVAQLHLFWQSQMLLVL